MKKMLLSCLMILLLSLASFAFLSQQSRTAKIDLQTQSGDSSFMEAVNWQTSYAINLKGFDLVLEKGKGHSTPSPESSQSVLLPYAEKQYYESSASSEHAYTVSGSQCKTFREPKDSLQVMYELRYLKAYGSIHVSTQLTQYSNAVYSLRKNIDVCEHYGNSSSYQQVYPNESNTWAGSYLQTEPSLMTDGNTEELINGEMQQGVVKAQDDVYYLMPATDAYTRGTNQIYRITLGEVKDQLYHSHEVDALTTLPEGRIYEQLLLIKESLVVFSHDDQNLYVQIYDKEGTSLGEVSFKNTYKEQLVSMRLFSNDQYLTITDGEQIYQVDCEKMTKIQLTWSDDTIQDMIYRNGCFYIASFTDRRDRYQFTVLQNQQMVYQGVLALSQDDQNVLEGFSRLGEGAFER